MLLLMYRNFQVLTHPIQAYSAIGCFLTGYRLAYTPLSAQTYLTPNQSSGKMASYTVVDTTITLSRAIEALIGLPAVPPSLYVDLEGIKLSRNGSISIIQLYVHPMNHTYLIDVHRLGSQAFSTTAANTTTTLKMILEANGIPKVFFDVRNDSDALFHHYQISLRGVQDLQLMELATRLYAKEYVSGLQKCIEKDAGMTYLEKMIWNTCKEKGLQLFSPEKGGRYEIFNERPLSEDIINYCVQDVQFLPRLWSHYHARIRGGWVDKVRLATEERVRYSQSATYDPHSREKAKAPVGWSTKQSTYGIFGRRY